MKRFHLKKTDSKTDNFEGYKIFNTQNESIMSMVYHQQSMRLKPYSHDDLKPYTFEDDYEFYNLNAVDIFSLLKEQLGNKEMYEKNHEILDNLIRLFNVFTRKIYLFEYNNDIYLYETTDAIYIVQTTGHKKLRGVYYDMCIYIYHKGTKEMKSIQIKDAKNQITTFYDLIYYIYEDTKISEHVKDMVEKDFLLLI